MHVCATVARVLTTRAGYTFLHLGRTHPACPLELVIRPDLLSNMVRHLQQRPAKPTGRVIVAERYVQAASGSAAQIWLARAPALSVEAP